jgi:hypothetical protein
MFFLTRFHQLAFAIDLQTVTTHRETWYGNCFCYIASPVRRRLAVTRARGIIAVIQVTAPTKMLLGSRIAETAGRARRGGRGSDA